MIKINKQRLLEFIQFLAQCEEFKYSSISKDSAEYFYNEFFNKEKNEKT